MSVVRGRPPGLAGGIRGASRAYCSSLSACPAPKSPTKARFSAVHMASLQEGVLPSFNRQHDHSASSSVSTARASQTASQSKGGISSIELGRRLGVTQTTAWKIKHKLTQVMMERDAAKRLSGRVEIDDAYLGGERSGGKRGRGSPGKTPFLAAVETTPEGKTVRLKLCRVPSFCSRAVEGFAKRSLERTCEVVSDGLPCFVAVTKAGCRHTVIKTGSGARAVRTPASRWVNTVLGNMKPAITGTYRSIAPKHVPRYLAECEYRFNRRYDLAAMLPRLAKAALQAPPMPYRLLKLAEVPA